MVPCKALLPFAILALVISSSFAYCPTEKREILLGAVTGEETGGIFHLGVEVRPGNGTIYTSVSPLTGFTTQESERQAADYAFKTTGIDKKDCDVYYRIWGGNGEERVDGPSAGGAMAIATRAALLGERIRQDVVVTGTIQDGGTLGEVGGVIEKAIASSDSGAHYILVPGIETYESFLLASLSSAKNFSAIEVKTVGDAERVLYSPDSESFTQPFNPKSKPLPSDLPQNKYDADTGRFSIVASGMVEDFGSTANSVVGLVPDGEVKNKLSAYFSDELEKYDTLISMGYPFTAANSAFLLSIDAQYARLWGQKPDIDNGIEEVQSCIDSIPKVKKTKENFQWMVGSDLRRIWAKERLNQTIEGRGDQSGYQTMRDLYFSYGWCRISKALARQAQDVGGQEVDESRLFALADEKLSKAMGALSSARAVDYDAAWHLQNGIAANQSGDFAVAIYESAYASTVQGIIGNGTPANLSSAVLSGLEGSRSSLWGRLYFDHGKYLYYNAMNSKAIPTDAYSMLVYSQALDSNQYEIDNALKQNDGKSTLPMPDSGQEGNFGGKNGDYAVAFSLAFFAFVLGAEIFRRLYFQMR